MNFDPKPPILQFRMVAGVGVDLVEVGRVEVALKRWGERLKGRLFTQREREEAARSPYPFASLAARFAAKEAFLKALGSGLFRVPFKEIEVMREPSGRPRLELHGSAAGLCRQRGVKGVHLSLSHEGGMAIAVVVLEA